MPLPSGFAYLMVVIIVFIVDKIIAPIWKVLTWPFRAIGKLFKK